MSRFVFAGNEIIPGTVVMTADGTITPKDDLRVILNISGGGTVSLSDGTDVTQRIEIANVSADTCSLTYKGTGGSTTASIYTNTGIRLLWVGSYWETSMSTAVTGIDDNSQPFAFNIDSLVKPDGVINLTGTDANGNPFDYGLGKLVLAADEDNLVTGVEVKTSKTYNGKPVYKKEISGTPTTISASARIIHYYTETISNISKLINAYGTMEYTDNGASYTVTLGSASFYGDSVRNVQYMSYILLDGSDVTGAVMRHPDFAMTPSKINITIEYTKTTD